MSNVKLAAFAALMLVGASGVAEAQMFRFTTCNRTGAAAFVAVSHRESPGSGTWIVSGWTRVPARTCTFIGTYPQGDFYHHANNSSGKWNGDFNLCVEYPGPFRRTNPPGYTCNDNEKIERFVERSVTTPTYTWNLDP